MHSSSTLLGKRVLCTVPVLRLPQSRYTVIDRCKGSRTFEYTISTVVAVQGAFVTVQDLAGVEHVVYAQEVHQV